LNVDAEIVKLLAWREAMLEADEDERAELASSLAPAAARALAMAMAMSDTALFVRLIEMRYRLMVGATLAQGCGEDLLAPV
jgi:hypothetical protein